MLNKNYKINKILITLSIIIIVTFGLNFYRSASDIYFEIGKNIEIFGTIYREVTLNYVDEVSPEVFMKNGVEGMLETLDPYSQFIDNSRKTDIDMLTTGRYGGIGVSIGVKNNELTITEIMAGYSAARQGIRVGDIIKEVNGVAVTPEILDTMSNAVRGEPGTEVAIKIKREGENSLLEFKLLREEIQVKSLSYADFIPNSDGVAYFKLDRFSRRAGEEIKLAIKELQGKSEIKYFILDLRNNPGGLLESATDVLNKLVNPKEKLVSTKGRNNESSREYFSKEEPMVKNVPIAVLINENSASASEIVAGAIQDLDRGIITGSQSYGKGLVQTVIPVSYNTALKLTTAKYYTPSGRCIQKLDYMHSTKGVFTQKPDSLKKIFFTKNNRKVMEAGGIAPDTVIKSFEFSNVSNELLKKGVFFKFATNYSNSNQGTDFKSQPQKRIIESFIKYLKEISFTYEDPVQIKINEIQKLIDNNKSLSKYAQDIKLLKEKMTSNAELDINDNKEEVYWLIISELESRNKGESGRLKMFYNIDTQLKETIKVLKNEKLYNNLLSIK